MTSPERRIWLLRHGTTTPESGNTERTMSVSSLATVRQTGERMSRPSLGIGLNVVGVSPKLRTKQTAGALGEGAGVERQRQVELDFLDSIPFDEVDPENSRKDLQRMLRQHKRLPPYFTEIGENVLENLITLEDEIQACVTHASIIVGLQLVLMERKALQRSMPSYSYLQAVGITIRPDRSAPQAVFAKDTEVRIF